MTLHDVTEDDLTQSTPVMTVTAAVKEPGKKQVKRRRRRKKTTCETCMHSGYERNLKPGREAQRFGPTDTDSSSDDQCWAKTRMRRNEKMKVFKKGRRREKSHQAYDGSLDTNTCEMASLPCKIPKEANPYSQYPTSVGNPTSYRRRMKVLKCKDSSVSLSTGLSAETNSFANRGTRRKENCCKDSLKCQGFCRDDNIIKKNIRGEGAGAEVQAPVTTVPHVRDPSPVNSNEVSEDLDVCRICHCEGDEENPLITPCLCTGTLRFVHQTCLHQWIKSSDTRCCELCKYDFVMETKLKPLRKWEKLQMTKSEKSKIVCSVTFHIIALTCVMWSLYVLIDRTAEEIKQGSENGVLEWPFWTKLMVVAIGFTGGLIFMYVQCKVYIQLWRRLKAYNRVIFVQNCPNKSKKLEDRDYTSNQNSNLKESVAVPVLQTSTIMQSCSAADAPESMAV
ncbi:hypothetical protein XELAEV_18003938mg [Xenopus laevis]|nr:hypothetical protein XELAEV_18003938mg [Xenopus laevis]